MEGPAGNSQYTLDGIKDAMRSCALLLTTLKGPLPTGLQIILWGSRSASRRLFTQAVPRHSRARRLFPLCV